MEQQLENKIIRLNLNGQKVILLRYDYSNIQNMEKKNEPNKYFRLIDYVSVVYITYENGKHIEVPIPNNFIDAINFTALKIPVDYIYSKYAIVTIVPLVTCTLENLNNITATAEWS